MRYLWVMMFVPFTAFATNYYCSPTGLGTNTGADSSHAFSLAYALGDSLPGSFQPGDTIWVEGGTYNVTTVYCRLTGNASSPIIVRNHNNERAIINIAPAYANEGIELTGDYGYTWFWGLEFTSTPTDRISAQTDQPYSDTDAPTGGIVSAAGEAHYGLKVINCTFHELWIGLNFFSYEVWAEFYGNNFYNIGIMRADAATGYPIYTRDRKTVSNNILGTSFSILLHVYSGSGTIDSTIIRQNIFYNGNAITGTHASGSEITFGTGARDDYADTLDENYFWWKGGPLNAKMTGSQYDTMNNSAITNNRFFVLDPPGSYLYGNSFGNTTITGNTFVSGGATHIYIQSPPGYVDDSYPSNTFLTATPTSGDSTYLLKNKYEDGRAHLVSYNWDKGDSIKVNVISTFNVGTTVYVYNANNPFGNVAYSQAVAADSTITIPMLAARWTPADVVGYTEPDTLNTFPGFGAFILTGTNTPPDPTITTSGTLSAFVAGKNQTSAEQTFSVSGIGIDDSITVTAPDKFLVSKTSGSGFASSISFTPSSGTVASSTVYVVYVPTEWGSSSGNIVCSSTGASSVNVAASGTASPPKVLLKR